MPVFLIILVLIAKEVWDWWQNRRAEAEFEERMRQIAADRAAGLLPPLRALRPEEIWPGLKPTRTDSGGSSGNGVSRVEGWWAEYKEYLNSDAWRQTRERALARDQYTCQHCGDRASEVHHLTYERMGHENLSDLVCLCTGCHAAEHGGKQGIRGNFDPGQEPAFQQKRGKKRDKNAPKRIRFH
jgi:hypothetical protein